MELSSWEAAGIAAKALTYALSLTAAGGAIFVLIFSQLLRTDERARIANVSIGFALIAAAFTALRLPIIAGTLGGDLSSMADSSLLQFVFQSSEGQAAAVRTASTFASLTAVPLPAIGAAAGDFGWLATLATIGGASPRGHDHQPTATTAASAAPTTIGTSLPGRSGGRSVSMVGVYPMQLVRTAKAA